MSMEQITARIEAEARQQAEAIVAAARQQAQRIAHDNRMQAQARRNEILEEYRLRAEEAREQAQSELRSESRYLRLSARQELIEETLEATSALFEQRGEEAQMGLLERVFRRNVEAAGGERPTVLVPGGQLEAVRTLLGQGATVEAGDFAHGFILSFSHFNVNYQSRELLRAWRDPLEAMAAQYLFGGESHEEPGS